MTVLRSSPSDGEEIWCRCDAGPHGFLSIAAHAHADALAVEVRHDGVDVLADPGTYCYHGELRWRRYFRSTLAHNTIEVGGQDQSKSGGPFLWTRHAQSRLIELESNSLGDITAWSAEHDGYGSLNPPVRHRRSVRLDSRLRRLEIVDCLETSGSHTFRFAFHLGPDVDAHVVGRSVELTWSNGTSKRTARLCLPNDLSWSLTRGQTDPVLGWYSSRFGEKQPAWAVIGKGACNGSGSDTFTTVLEFVVEFGLRPCCDSRSRLCGAPITFTTGFQSREGHEGRVVWARWSPADGCVDSMRKLVQPRRDVVGIKVPLEAIGCGACGLLTLRLVVEKLDQYRRRLDRIVERPISPLDSVVEEL